MQGYIQQLRGAVDPKLLIICAGDIFDKWNAPPELINFLIKELPFMHAIPGQHDLPDHVYEDIKKSAYWTLVEAGKIKDMRTYNGSPESVYRFITPGAPDLAVYAYPWGKTDNLKRILPHTYEGSLSLAVLHAYCWTEGRVFGGPERPSETSHYKNWSLILSKMGYNAAVFGDNHKGFYTDKWSSPSLINTGTFIRRKVDELDYKPMIGILFSDGTIQPHYLDISQDEFIQTTGLQQSSSMGNYEVILRELRGASNTVLDFCEALEQAISQEEDKELRAYLISKLSQVTKK